MNTQEQEKLEFPSNPVDKPGYELVFNDEFQDESLDLGKWLPYYLPQWSDRQLAGARYTLKGRSLELLIEEAQPPWCPEYDGQVRVSSIQTGCHSGPVGSSIGQHRFNPHLTVSQAQPTLKLYTPQYGYFETRLKAVPIPGYMVAIWMIGFEDRPEHSAEICICEIFGSQVFPGCSGIGYGLHPFSDPTITDEFYRENQDFSAADFHIYAAEWTPTYVEFLFDNRSIRTIQQSPHYPMQFMIGLYEIPEQLGTTSEECLWPKVMEVDYFRGYRPVHNYR